MILLLSVTFLFLSIVLKRRFSNGEGLLFGAFVRASNERLTFGFSLGCCPGVCILMDEMGEPT
jgi:hypothetical protein